MACLSFNNNDSQNIKTVNDWVITAASGYNKSTRGGKPIKSIAKDIMSNVVRDKYYKLDSIDEIVDLKNYIYTAIEESNLFDSNDIIKLQSILDHSFQSFIRDSGLSSTSISINTGVTRNNKINFANVYSNVLSVKNYLANMIKAEFMNNGSINFETGKMILNDDVLNDNYIALIESTYNNLIDFINYNNEKKGVAKVDIPLYDERGRVQNVNITKALNYASPFIEAINIDSINSFYRTKDSNEASLLNLKGHFAYVLMNGNNFDKMISDTVGNMIEIDNRFAAIPNKDDMKYSLSDRTNLIKTFRANEFANAIDEIGSRQRNTIESTPMLDYETGKRIGESFISVNEFINIGNKLKSKVVADTFLNTTKNMLNTMRSNPTEYTKAILDEIVKSHKETAYNHFRPNELNIIKSIHHRFYDTTNPNSLYNIVTNSLNNSDYVQNYNFMNSISYMFDRSMPTDYMQYTINDYNQIIVTSVNRDNYNTKKFKFENDINIHLRNMFSEDRDNLIKKYNIEPDGDDMGSMRFKLQLPDGDITLLFKKTKKATDESFTIINSNNLSYKTGDVLKQIKAIPKEELENVYFYNNTAQLYDSGQLLYKKLIEFASDVTGIDFLSESRIRQFNNIKHLLNDNSDLIMPLSRLATSAAHKLTIYNDYFTNNKIKEKYEKIVDYAASLPYYNSLTALDYSDRLYFNKNNDSLIVPEIRDFDFTDGYALAEEIVDGTSFKPYVVNAEQNKLPNNRISHLAGLFDHVSNTLIKPNEKSALRNNFFINNRNLLLGNVVKTDINIRGFAKPLKKATKSELTYASLVYNFFGALKGYSDKKSVDIEKSKYELPSRIISQNLVVSDKKHFIDTIIDADSKFKLSNGVTTNLKNISLYDLTVAINDTVGDFYKNLASEIRDDYTNIFSKTDIDLLFENSLNELRNKLDTAEFYDYSKFEYEAEISEAEGVTRYTLDNRVIDLVKDLLDNNLISTVDVGNNKSVLTVYNDTNITPQGLAVMIDEYLSNIDKSYVASMKRVRDLRNLRNNTRNKINTTFINIYDSLSTQNVSKRRSSISSGISYINNLINNSSSIVNKLSDLLNAQSSINSRLPREEFIESLYNITSNLSNYATLEDFDFAMQSLSSSEFVELADAANVNLVNNLHYNKVNGKLRGNNSLVYNSEYLFSKDSEFAKFFGNEFNKLAKELLDNNIRLDISTNEGNEVIPLKWAINYYLGERADSWIDSDMNRIIIAKDKSGNILTSSTFDKALQLNQVQVNPLLKRYALVSYLLSKNYRNVMMGTELAYPPGRDTTYKPTLENIEMETSAQDLAQSKRSVIYSGPIQNFGISDLYGIHREARVAIIDDNSISVNNFSGLSDKHDVDDGSAFVDMYTVFLENKSLQDLATGDIKKTLAWDFNEKYHNGKLMKFATFPLSNEFMRNSQNEGGHDLYKMFKKMTDFKFEEDFDLTKSFNGRTLSLRDLAEGEMLYKEVPFKKATFKKSPDNMGPNYVKGDYTIYNDNGDIIVESKDNIYRNSKKMKIENGFNNVAIMDIKKTPVPFQYVLTLEPVDTDGSIIVKNNEGMYNEVVTIDSLYTLHKALGGLTAKQMKNGELQYSDLNFLVGANIMNMVGTKTEGAENTMLSQENVHQPLKGPKYRISYLANKSAFKTGAENVNDNALYHNDMALKSVKFNMDYTGIQSDTESYVDPNSSVTEPSQFISLIAAKGLTQEHTSKAYNAISSIARNSIKDLRDVIDSYIDSSDSDPILFEKSKLQLYNLISSELTKSLKVDDNTYGMQKGIINILFENLDSLRNNIVSKLDSLDFKLPGSDPAIYKKIVIDMTSRINSMSIKRKLRGVASTLVPSYNKIKFYRIGDSSYKYDDLVKLSTTFNIVDLVSDYADNTEVLNYMETNFKESDFNSDIPVDVKHYLNILQMIQDFKNITLLKTESNVYLDLDEVNEHREINPNNSMLKYIREDGSISIDNYDKYIFVKDNFTRFKDDIIRPSNLRPTEISWMLDNTSSMNLFDLESVRKSFIFNGIKNNFSKALNKYENNPISFKYIKDAYNKFVESSTNLDIAGLNTENLGDYRNIESLMDIVNNVKLISTLVLNNVETAIGSLSDGLVEINKTYMDNVGFDYDAYETVYKKGLAFIKLNPKLNQSNYEVVLPKVFATEFNLKQNDSVSNILKQGPRFFKDQYMLSRAITNSDYDLALSNSNNENILIKVKNEVTDRKLANYIKTDYDANNTILFNNSIYLKDKDGNRSLKVGEINKEGDSKYSIEIYTAGNGEKLYHVNKDGFKNILTSNVRTYDNISLNPINIPFSNVSIRRFVKEMKNDGLIKGNLLNSLYRVMNNKALKNTEIVESLRKIMYDNMDSLAERKFASFKKALECIIVRIPAQTMQSAMKMNVVGFTESDSTSAYVSRMQTWLQGSDYDIDTGWVISPDINESGLYQGWSPYFNINSYELLKTSEAFPVPNGKTYKEGEINAIDVSQFAIKINELEYEDYKNNADYISLLAQLLNKVDKYTNIKAQEGISLDKTLEIINTHNNYFNPDSRFSLNTNQTNRALRNAISASLMDIISDPRNLVQSTIPINMDDPARAAKKSPLGVKTKKINFNIPTGMHENQTQNMVGQDVIGIAATAEKIFFASTFYYNEALKSGDKETISRLPFFKHYQSISKDPKTMLANINYDHAVESFSLLNEYIKEHIADKSTDNDGNLLISDAIIDTYSKMSYKIGEDQALIISAMLSAATDNAKELILAKINAGPDTVGMYLYASMLGYDFESIANFMTHPLVQEIIDLHKFNSFEDGFKNVTFDSVFSLIDNGPRIDDLMSSSVKIKDPSNPRSFEYMPVNDPETGRNVFRDFYSFKTGIYRKSNPYRDSVGYTNATIEEFILSRFIPDYMDDINITKGLKLKAHKAMFDEMDYIKLNRYIELFNKYLDVNKRFNSYVPVTFVSKMKTANTSYDAIYKAKPHLKTKPKTVYQDFKDLYKSSKDTIFFGSLLSINQGMDTRVEERLALIDRVNKHFNDKIANYERYIDADISRYNRGLSDNKLKEIMKSIKDNGLLVGKFDFIKFIGPDQAYRDAAIAVYNVVKDSINIFDVIDKVPHYKAMYESLWYTHAKDKLGLYKYRTTYDLMTTINNKLGVMIKAPHISKLESFIDNKMILYWLNNSNISIDLKKGDRILDNTYKEKISDIDTKINLSTEYGRNAFKYYVENVVYPKLKNSDILKNKNAFIDGLKFDYRKNNLTGYQVQYLNMSTDITNQSDPHNVILTERYTKALRDLHNIKIGSVSAKDIFFLYNLIINKNKSGKNTLTNLFSEFNLDRGGIEYQYMKYVSDVDNGIIKIPNSDSSDNMYDLAALGIEIFLDSKNSVFIFGKNSYISRDVDKDSGLITYSGIGLGDYIRDINVPLHYDTESTNNFYNYSTFKTFNVTDKYYYLAESNKNTNINNLEFDNIDIGQEGAKRQNFNISKDLSLPDLILYFKNKLMSNNINITFDC